MELNDEERLIAQEIEGAEDALRAIEAELKRLNENKKRYEQKLKAAKQAALDYMQGNGLTESTYFKLRKSSYVDVIDAEAVPEEFMRVKVTRAPDLEKIRKEAPRGVNWYKIETRTHVMRSAGDEL